MRLVAVMAAAVLGLGAAPAAAGHWVNAIEVPGTAALNGKAPFPLAELNSLSCVPGGFCAAGGFYTDHAGHTQAFVAVRRHDRWGIAIEVPGTAGLNKKNAEVASVSCASAGRCAAGGTYEDSHFGSHAFVVTLREGRWTRAVEVPGTRMARASVSEVTAVSCVTAECVAGGDYTTHGVGQPFVAAERDGRWDAAATLPGMAKLNVGRFARLISLSCPSAGNCVAAGDYAPRQFLREPSGTKVFVAAQRDGKWGVARQVRTPATLKVSDAYFDALSCPSAGNCTLAGQYANTKGSTPSFVISERRGRWGTPVGFPSTSIGIIVLSCAAPGNCLAGGEIPGATVQQSLAYLVAERNGRWGKPFQAPGTALLNTGDDAYTEAVSCWSAGNCIAGGTYTNATSSQAFAVTEHNGHWGTAFEVPGTGQLNTGRNAAVTVLSCTAGGVCGVGGDYSAGPGGGQSGEVFVATRT